MSKSYSESRDLRWRKAKGSAGDGECVELASGDGRVFVRDSKNPKGCRLQYPARSWHDFVSMVKHESTLQ